MRLFIVLIFDPLEALESNKRTSMENGDWGKTCALMSEFSLSFTKRLIISGFTTEAHGV